VNGNVHAIGLLQAHEAQWMQWNSGQWRSNGPVIVAGILNVDGRLSTNGWDSGWANSLGGDLIISGGTIAIAASAGHTLSWNGTDLSTTMNFRSAGYLFATSRLISNNWDIGRANSLGGELDVASTVTVHGGQLFLEGSRQVQLWWRGDLNAIYIPYGAGIYTHGATIAGGMTVTGNIATGTIHVQNGVATLSGGASSASIYLFAGNPYFVIDGNWSIRRDGNHFHATVWEGVYYWFRAHDNHHCGTIDGNGWHNGSDLRHKRNITSIRDGLSLVLDERIQPIRYITPGAPGVQGVHGLGSKGEDVVRDYPATPDLPGLGFGAQDMVQVIPEVVSRDLDTDEPMAINYGALVAVLWDAVRTLSARDEALERRVAELEGRAA
jgi:hypothetical protein